MTYKTYNRRNRRNKRISRKLKNMFSGMLLLVCMVQALFLSLFACYHQLTSYLTLVFMTSQSFHWL